MKPQVCIDASFGIKIVLIENDSERVEQLWEQWIQTETRIFAPPLFLYESVSVIRGRVYRDLLTSDEGDRAFQELLAQAIEILSPQGIDERAWNLAKQLNQPKVYDCYYLALAELLNCDFWTADERLYNTVKQRLAWVKWIGDTTALQPLNRQ